MGLISLLFKGLSRVFSSTTIQKHHFYGALYSPTVNISSIFTSGILVTNLPAITGSAKRHKFNSWVGEMLWSRKWQPTPVFLPRKFYGQRSLVDYSPWGHKESDMTEGMPTHIVTSLHDHWKNHSFGYRDVCWQSHVFAF